MNSVSWAWPEQFFTPSSITSPLPLAGYCQYTDGVGTPSDKHFKTAFPPALTETELPGSTLLICGDSAE